MPWFKCSACRIRRSGLDVAMSAAKDRCPLCEQPLEPTSDLASLVGFRYLTLAGAEPPVVLPGTGRALDAVSDAVAAERWLDEGGGGEPGR